MKIEGIEKRQVESTLQIEERADGNGNKIVRVYGYAAKFNERSNLIANWFYEEIAEGAFTEVLANDPDVRFLLNHDPNHVFGRTRAKTLRLSQDEIGLAFECDFPDSNQAADIVESIRRGDINQCSFAFRIAPVDGDSWFENEKDELIRTIKKISQLSDVCLATYPAYDSTIAEARAQSFKTNLHWELESEQRQRELELVELCLDI